MSLENGLIRPEIFQKLFEESPIGVELYDAEGKLVRVNRACLDIFGVDSASDVKGFDLFGDPNVSEEVKSKLRKGETARYESAFDFEKVKDLGLYATRKNGTIHIDVMITPIFSGDGGPFLGYMAQVQDITARKLAEMEAVSGRELWERTFEAVGEGVFIVDERNTLLQCNEAFAHLVGRPREELLGLKCHQIVHGSGSPPEFCAAHRALRERRRVHEVLYESYLGKHLELNASLVEGIEGGGTLIVHTLRDVSEREEAQRALKESEERLRDIFDNTSDLIQSVDPEGRFLYVNRAWRETLGYTEEEAKELVLWDIVHPASMDHCRESFERVMAGETLGGVEAVFMSKNGDGIMVEGNISCRFGDGRPLGTRAIFRDITQRKLAEYELARFADEIARSNRELENFAYIASHDLQEPLRMVISYLQLLERRYGDKLGSEAHDYIDFAVDGASRMKAMIEGLLAYSRVGTREMKPAPADCEEILREVLENLGLAIEDSGARITHDRLPVVMGDEVQLVQLFQNLISNAIKFRGEEPPRIHVSASQQNGEWIFSVRDNGIGIEAQQRERIFDIFQRLHTREEYQGTGIGLALAKKIVERHHGRIWVVSEPGHGSTFYFSIPEQGGETA